MTCSGFRQLLARFFRVGFDEVGDAVHERMREALFDGLFAPGEIFLLGLGAALAFELGGGLEQAIGRVGAAVEDHVLAKFAQFGRDVVVQRQLAGIDDAHVHAGLDRVIEEHRVHGFAHRLVAAEGERQVRDAARDVDERHLLLDLARRLDEGDAVAVVFLDAGRDREDVGIEDDVFRRKADFFGQELVGALADRNLALDRVGLALLVESHDDDGGAVAQHLARLFEERPLAFLHRDRIDDRLALHALQAGFDDAPFGAVDHDRHARDIGLGGDEIEERGHGLLGVEQAFVHVDVDDLGAGFHLLARDRRARRIVVLLDELPEFGRAGDVGALADVDENGARRSRGSLGLLRWMWSLLIRYQAFGNLLLP